MKKKKKKNFKNDIIDYLKDEWKFLLFCVVLTCILLFPLDYYITTGGGTSNIDKRVFIEDSYKSKGSLNIAYVSQIKGDVLSYGLSYIIPSWEREKYSKYKIDDEESLKDLEFRDKLDLEYSNSNATYWGFKLAGEDVQLESTNVYVVYVYKKYNSLFKVQDQLLSIDGRTYDSIGQYREYFDTLNEGDTVSVKVLRNKRVKEFDAKLYRSEDRNILGIAFTVIKKYKTKKNIKFKFNGNESGPSGGLMTTLDIYNKLTKKDITDGLKVAGTGTIEIDGTIGEIGGIKFKIIGAAKDKVDVFLVPKANYKEAIKTIKDNKLKLKIISVDNIEDAIEKLSNLER